VAARGHDRLSTFGLMRETGVAELRGYIEQLIAHQLLRQTDDAFPVLALTAAGVALMKDAAAHTGLALARQRRPAAGKPAKHARIETESWHDVDRDLFERLRALRLEVARARGVPPYVIFHDATLREMARLKPATSDALRAVKGVGERKVEDLGEIFLAAIGGQRLPRASPSTRRGHLGSAEAGEGLVTHREVVDDRRDHDR
jgi:ATP-dependent DNA helicase RecQ